MAALIPYEEALDAVLAACEPVGVEPIPLTEARGRVLAVTPEVTHPLPPFPSSAMDGFAVRWADLAGGPVTLPLDPAVPAGTDPPALSPGHAAPIATGGPIPPGADTIVPIEDAVTGTGAVTLPRIASYGAHVRPAGSDLPVGPSPLVVGRPLDAPAAAILAALGVVMVSAYRRPRVAILATGSELVPMERTPGPAQIRDSNSIALAYAHAQAGAEVRLLGIAPDETDATRRMLADALDADLVLTCAGVSVGDRDLVRGLLADLGVEPVFWGVDLKPGKPVAFGLAGRTPVISLPGNPASALVCSTLLAEPATRARGGWNEPAPRREWASAAGEWPSPEGRLHAVRCSLEPDPTLGVRATPTGDQRSHRMASMLGADGLALIPPGLGVTPGDRVEVVRGG